MERLMLRVVVQLKTVVLQNKIEPKLQQFMLPPCGWRPTQQQYWQRPLQTASKS